MINWKKIVNSIAFLFIGVLLFWYVYKDINIGKITSSISELKIGWIILSFILGLLSHIFRAIRWKMLITPLNYNPKTSNLFFSVLILYFTNLIIPRGGEIARCGVIAKYEKIPFVKLIGSVLVERLTDLITFFVIFSIVLIWQYGFIMDVLKTASIGSFFSSGLKIAIIAGTFALLIFLFFIIKRSARFRSFIHKIKFDLMQGLGGIRLIKKPFEYIAYTLLIFFLWLLMLYVVFFAYVPTNGLSFSAAVLTYTVGTLAYLLPIQAGIGAWHFLVIQCLFLFGLDKESGMMFALIAHTFTNLIYLVFGAIGFVILPIVNRGDQKG